ncbi:MAG TPA: metal ABC transporter permease [Candidatus Hydrothermia bacterium]|nr:metal ABC transporter permease [Candidatus Hydrothermae bacterium]HOK22729.1 metal ABC transporter permease [Candidatus Hydrothermia bacterium]HOL23438.1 metal ABC transporter permease [Candidatus Hydrothermia bacterium]HOP32435.1 metal ABC transporter permease [Candidatus Hydrothermia bacterium]HPO78378.1 metal ABC transporter permease [Candidatus Hydrothermia bacterium]
MAELFGLPVIQRAFIAVLLAGAFLPLAGTFTILTETSFLSAGLAHIAFAGVAIGYAFKTNPLISALAVTVVSAYFLWMVSERTHGKYEQTLSILFSFFMALGIIFFGLSKSYTADAISYLFGSPLASTGADVMLLFGALVAYSIFVVIYRRELFHMVFSSELALAAGINVSVFRLLFFLFTALSVVLSMKAVGALVVFGLMVIPPSVSQRFSKHFNQMVLGSVFVGIFSAVTGFIISLFLDIPVGASVVVVATILYFISVTVRK